MSLGKATVFGSFGLLFDRGLFIRKDFYLEVRSHANLQFERRQAKLTNFRQMYARNSETCELFVEK